VALLSILHRFSAGPVLIAHILRIHVQRLTHYFRTALVALLSILRLVILLGLKLTCCTGNGLLSAKLRPTINFHSCD
jgi:hypothetical protein